ncbi:hypothetical protein WN944_023378 [Citrus x changshan-huyou]|uniref:Prolamin-like domain-containing protein n=1 Tax=Citrus x changshan-huyou TaxID=2935761 RepID=A0AAP0N022_9ROSI
MAQATAARNLADQATDCVKALGEFVSCKNLTVQFFLIGKADIANCCRAIDDIIKSKCNWPAPLISLGYTPEQISNMLKAYCDAIASSLCPDSINFRQKLMELMLISFQRFCYSYIINPPQ